MGAELIFRIKFFGSSRAFQSFVKSDNITSMLGIDSWMISDPDLGYRLNPSDPEINELSMKDREVTSPKPTGVFRILVLGDSVTYLGRPNFVDLLKQRFSIYPKIEVYNAGTPGYTTYQELVYLKKYISLIQPDLVILSYCTNDNFKFLHSFNYRGTMIVADEVITKFEKNHFLEKFAKKSLILAMVRQQYVENQIEKKVVEYPWEKTLDFNQAWIDQSWPEFGLYLEEIKLVSNNNNAGLVVVTFPLEMQFNPGLAQKNYDYVTKPQAKVAFYSKQLNVPNLDLFSTFFNFHQTDEPFLDGVHLNGKGAILAADSIFNFLQANSAVLAEIIQASQSAQLGNGIR